MKRIVVLSFLLCLLMSCATTENVDIQDEPMNQVNQINETDAIGQTGEDNFPSVRVVGPPQPMAAPTENEQAMMAYNTGTMLLHENKLEEAEKYLKEAIELDPLFVDAMDHLGMVYRRLNRLSEAEEMYLRSIEIVKDNLIPYQNLAIVYRLQGRLNEAFDLYKTMITIDENNPEPYYGIGQLFYMVGDYEPSLMFFDIAIELYLSVNSPYVYDALLHKGMIYYNMGDYNEALKYLEEVHKVYPNNEMVNQMINEIKNEEV